MFESKHTLRASPHYKWYALAAVMLGTFMSPLDASIANVALPTIGRAFHTPVDSTEWVLLSYMLVTSSTLVLFGRLGDLIGQKRVYVIGFAIFGLSSVACAFAPAFWALVAARAVQGLGSAMLMSSSPAIITDAFPASERGRAIGLNGAAVAVGLSTGPVLGGVIVTYSDWRWIFLINVPIAILALAASAFVLRREERKREPFDFAGAAIAFTTLFALSLALSRAHVWGWGSPATVGCLIYAFLGVAAFLPISALNVILAPAAGALSDRVPARYISTAGALVMLAGVVFLALLPASPSTTLLYCALVVTGAGTAVFSQPNNSTIMGAAPPNRRGIAAGTLATARTSGQLLGVCVAGAIYFYREQHLGALAHSYLPAKSVFFAVAAIMVCVAAVSYNRD